MWQCHGTYFVKSLIKENAKTSTISKLLNELGKTVTNNNNIVNELNK